MTLPYPREILPDHLVSLHSYGQSRGGGGHSGRSEQSTLAERLAHSLVPVTLIWIRPDSMIIPQAWLASTEWGD